jgi:hypothetical protein
MTVPALLVDVPQVAHTIMQEVGAIPCPSISRKSLRNRIGVSADRQRLSLGVVVFILAMGRVRSVAVQRDPIITRAASTRLPDQLPRLQVMPISAGAVDANLWSSETTRWAVSMEAITTLQVARLMSYE